MAVKSRKVILMMILHCKKPLEKVKKIQIIKKQELRNTTKNKTGMNFCL